MVQQLYSEIVTDDLLVNSLDHDVHPGFLEDYRVLTALLRIYKPKTIFEIGTNTANGVNVMATALPEAKIYSLDLDYETMKLDSKQYPIGTNGEDRVGSEARFPYTQLRGDSMTFDYSQFPCEAYYLDGEHTTKNVKHEVTEVLKQNPILVVLHDTDMQEVMEGLLKGYSEYNFKDYYTLCRVMGTRISYLLKNSTK